MHLEVVAHAKPCREKGKMVCVLEPREGGSGWDQRCWLGQEAGQEELLGQESPQGYEEAHSTLLGRVGGLGWEW